MAESWFDALADEAANGVSATAAVGAVLGGPAGAAVAGASVAARMADAAGGGGSWSFDEDEIDAVIKDWKALAEELEEDRQIFSSSQQFFYPPSNDHPSSTFMNSLNDGFLALEQSNKSMRDYVLGFIERLERATSSIVSSDGDSAGSFEQGASNA
ncbi:hypothetical protein [Saccharomonospora xinjiangensis]|uniref:PE domain-containing protein n=1 Tax=Saccharomonospora xinjiangensis XJ-54 TaxID=882086 RepID=I0V574_9PSEU|nr:hypothetical protein [Saccharomonospora xinjiangensis]EID55277.1 hypothetical protein SacxiDRAFT_3068 [Saccharomonospora xinjiangensis XJ-54]